MGQVHVHGRSVGQGCQQWDVAQLSTAEEPGTARAAEARVSHGPAVLKVAQDCLRGQPAVQMMGTSWCGFSSLPAMWVPTVDIPKGSGAGQREGADSP